VQKPGGKAIETNGGMLATEPSRKNGGYLRRNTLKTMGLLLENIK
jgi:hypothetical protein